MAEKDEEGTGTDEGHSVDEMDDVDLHEEGDEFENDDSDLSDDEETETDEGEGDPSSDTDEDVQFEQRYKDLQSTYDKSQNALKESRDQNSAFEHKFSKFGGIDNALAALDLVTSDKDFLDLANKKANNKPLDGIDETNLSPQQKEAINTVRKIVQGEVGLVKAELDRQLKDLKSREIDPATSAIRDANLDVHITKMTAKFGEGWLKQLDSMDRLKDTLSEQAKIAPSLDDIESLFIESLRKDGKLDDFMVERVKLLTDKKTQKSTKRHKTSGSSTSSSNKDTKAADIFEAGARALEKMKQ